MAAAFTENILFYDPNEDTLIQYGGIGPIGMEEPILWLSYF
jgi:hypothetical protein